MPDGYTNREYGVGATTDIRYPLYIYDLFSHDVLATDPLGGLKLSIADVAQSHKLVFQRLTALSIPTVFLGGGGYGKDSAL